MTLTPRYITYRSRSAQVPAFSIEPLKTTGSLVVLHEVWGLLPHIKDICKRLGKLGFATFAPNLYWKHEDLLVPEKIRTAMAAVWGLPLEERYDLQKVRRELANKHVSAETFDVIAVLYNRHFRDQMLRDATSCVQYALSRYDRVGSIGFCMGGGLSIRLATKINRLASCVVFYGEPPYPRDVAKINSPVLSIHAGTDEIINSKVPGFVEAAITSGKDLTLRVYSKTRHGFFNDTNEELYDKEAAEDAWELTKWFLERTLAKGYRSH